MPWGLALANPAPAVPVTADYPACVRCTWQWSAGRWRLKFVCRACQAHGGPASRGRETR
jgi:hypothetical protein